MNILLKPSAAARFKAPETSLGDLDASVAAKVIAAAADVALVLGADGVIRDVAFGGDELSRSGDESWLGRPWADTVTVESRPKIEALLRDARADAPRWRQVNHPSPGAPDIPVLYAAVPVGPDGRVVAVGRDLRSVAVLQQRLVDAQASMERDYAKLRHAETRYRLLFQIASEPVLIVDASSHKVVEANPAAAALLGAPVNRVVGRFFADVFVAGSGRAVAGLVDRARTAGRADDVSARLSGEGGQDVLVSASLFRQDGASHLLVRLAPVEAWASAIVVPKAKSRLIQVVESLPDGFVVTDLAQRVLTANAAFLDLAQLATEEQARGESLDRWLGRSSVELEVLVASLREHGSVRNFGTVLRGEYGTAEEVEVSAVSVANGEQPCFGFTLRSASRRPATIAGRAAAGRADEGLPRSVAQLMDLVGRVPLKDLVRESTDVIERRCIEAALELTGDNRASAAEILGLSRQSLYAKLRRYGLGDLDPAGAD